MSFNKFILLLFVLYKMEGEQKKSKSEKMKDTPIRTDKVGADGTGTVVESCSTDLPGPAASRMVALEALIRGIKVPQCRWPGEMLKAVIDRFGRMPRDGWLLSHSLYCEMFKCETRLDELKKQENFAITSAAGGQCSPRNRPSVSRQLTRTLRRVRFTRRRFTWKSSKNTMY